MAKFSEVSGMTIRHEGQFVVGARARFFDAGTNTPKTAYQDGNLTAEFDPDEIRSDANAMLPSIWVQGATAYRVKITTADGEMIRDIDYLPGEVSGGGGGGGGGGGDDLDTGDCIWSPRTGTRADYVRANGRTIGSAASLASERADDACEDLFLLLWPINSLEVSGGRGVSAAADWAANKTIALIDLRGRGPWGLDDMGNTTANRLSGATFLSGNGITLGSVGGAGTHALTSAQNGPHVHTGTTDNAGSHSHSGTTASGGTHTHTATTATGGAHNHGGTTDNGGAHFHNGTVDPVGDHQHGYLDGGTGGSVSVPFGGAASPSTPGDSGRTTSAAGAHAHTYTTSTASNHVHVIAQDSGHQHIISVADGGAHTHTYTTDTAAAHQHGFTTAASGSGEAHNNMPPFVLGTWYMRL